MQSLLLLSLLTPIEQNHRLTDIDELYPQFDGKLAMSRPGIACEVFVVSQFMHFFPTSHLDAAT